MGYVSQFLRVIPRVSALDVVAEPLAGCGRRRPTQVRSRAAERPRAWLDAPEAFPSACGTLPPATFSGGEQQRINIARSLIKPRPLLLLDEPTASLDKANTDTVIALIREARLPRRRAGGHLPRPRTVGAAVATRRI